MERDSLAQQINLFDRIIKDPETQQKFYAAHKAGAADYRDEALSRVSKDKHHQHKRALKDITLKSVVKVTKYPFPFISLLIKIVLIQVVPYAYMYTRLRQLQVLSEPLLRRVNLIATVKSI